MNRTIRRRPRISLEPLEPRALMAVAGSLDPGFGAGHGLATASLGVPIVVGSGGLGTYAYAGPTIALADGNILVSSMITEYPTSTDSSAFEVEELNANGSVDTAFGTGGRVLLPIALDQITVMAAQANGQILLASTTSSSSAAGETYMVVRLNANGSVDTSFGAGGVAEYPAGITTPTNDRIEAIESVVPESDGKILLAGSSFGGFSAVQLNADGSLDTAYGTDGTATVPVNVDGATDPTAVLPAIQANGQLVMAGTVNLTDNFGVPTYYAEIAVTRLNTDGSLDTTFGGPSAAGVVLIPSLSANSQPTGLSTASALAIDPTTGDILLAATLSPPGTASFPGARSPSSSPSGPVLYRLNPDGTPDTSFGTGGVVELAVTDTIDGMLVQANGDILLTTYFFNATPSTPTAVSYETLEETRLNPDGTPDPSFGTLVGRSASSLDLPILAPDGDLVLAGIGTVSSPSGPTYGIEVESVLTTATTGPAASPIPQPPPADFTGLGYSDAAVYDPTTASFLYESTITATETIPYTFAFGVKGVGQTIPAAADYTGAGLTQIAAYLSASGVYAILPTATSPGLFLPFGIAGAGQSIPAPADYFGTGQADVAVYLPALADYAILQPGNTTGEVVHFGIAGAGQSIPAPADYYGTGQADVAVYLAQIGAFAIQDPSGKSSGALIPFGKPGLGNSIPVPGDYDGSGKAELAVYVPSVGAFFYRPNGGGPDVIVPMGVPNSGDIPVPGDYDGSGHLEFAIYSPIGGALEYKPADGGPDVVVAIGSPNNGSIPVAALAGNLPEFAAPNSGSGSNAIRSAFVPTVSAESVTASAIRVSKTSAVPSGPALAAFRGVPRSLINQAAPAPWKIE
jgi:uncharacterized delta-60 repeat protein